MLLSRLDERLVARQHASRLDELGLDALAFGDCRAEARLRLGELLALSAVVVECDGQG